jgi:hypothetical protein
LSVVSCQLSVLSSQFSVLSCRKIVIHNLELSTRNWELTTDYCSPPAARFKHFPDFASEHMQFEGLLQDLRFFAIARQ